MLDRGGVSPYGRLFMKHGLFVLISVFALPQAVPAQDSGFVEVHFNRFHHKNGNFIDGESILQKTDDVILKLKSGEIAIRRDTIDRIEFIKLRGLSEKPEEIENPKPPAEASGARS